MDQFCANADDAYRRCICSAKLTEIQDQERRLAQAGQQLQDFQDLNISVIPQTAKEVHAMLSASAGESAIKTDTSASATTLSGISDVLSTTKSKALSTQGTVDIAGDINSIWATSSLTSGAAIANLTGESLYNAVHSQCVELVSQNCTGIATLNMIVSAYAMYIENDCSLISAAIDKKMATANSSIRQANTQMQNARLENYDAHNSTSINDCIAAVRTDITADTACGADYVHCLDLTGKYLNHETGAPIYTAEFFELGYTLSLDGDVLNNKTNSMLVAELERKRIFAEHSLETCRDLADDVWDEFLRQAIVEIYQGQQSRIRTVKNECLDVVNQCYDTQNEQLKDFSNVKEQLLLGSRMELGEEMCAEKLNTCANLYGGGKQGMRELVSAMRAITDQKIAKECKTALSEYAADVCAVPKTDTLHKYPFGCRAYVPGAAHYATIDRCNRIIADSSTGNADMTPIPTGTSAVPPTCASRIQYTECKKGYYLSTVEDTAYEPTNATMCRPCPDGYQCPGRDSAPQSSDINIQCGDYPGSLYQKLVRYALQACIRPTESTNPIPTHILSDVNIVMDSIRADMAKVLSDECDRLGGVWVNTPNYDTASTATYATLGETAPVAETNAGTEKWKHFYSETGANTGWGYCAEPLTETNTPAKQGCLNSGGAWNGTACNCPIQKPTWDTTNNTCIASTSTD